MVTTNETKKRGRPRKTQDTQGQMSIFTGSEAGREARAEMVAASESTTINALADDFAKIFDGKVGELELLGASLSFCIAAGSLDKGIMDLFADAQEGLMEAVKPLSKLVYTLRRAAEAYKADEARQERVRRTMVKKYEQLDEDDDTIPELAPEKVQALADYMGLPVDDPDFSVEDAIATLVLSVKKSAYENLGMGL
jgi:hypothetical protein